MLSNYKYLITLDGNFYCVPANELYHHGIKGQKWGVRRFQNSDGSLTSAGKKRYSDDGQESNSSNSSKSSDTSESSQAKSKSKHRQKLEEGYQKAGLSKKDAEAEASKRIRAEKILAASAAVAVTACAAYAANKVLKERVDGIIKAGEALQRIEFQNTNGKLHETFYVAKGKHDKQRYYNMLGSTRQSQVGIAYMMKLEANENVRVASKKNAEKVFKELLDSDDGFRQNVFKQASRHFSGSNEVDLSKLSSDKSGKELSKLYENFNSNLIHIRGSGSGADKKFYEALKSKGYGAIQDINDMKFSGYNAKNPLIVFDGANKNIMVKSMSQIKENLGAAGQKERELARKEPEIAKMIEKYGTMTAATLTGASVLAYNSKPAASQNSKVNVNSALNQYSNLIANKRR